MRGSETVTVVPKVHVDRLRPSGGSTLPEYDLKGCHVLPRVNTEAEGGVVGIDGFDVYYFGGVRAPNHDWQVRIRGALHEIDDQPRDFIVKGRRKALIFATKRVG